MTGDEHAKARAAWAAALKESMAEHREVLEILALIDRDPKVRAEWEAKLARKNG